MTQARLKELLVLGAVRAHPSHGYALAEALAGGFGAAASLTQPTIYATLRRFEQRGWITGSTRREGNYPERNVYRVTRAGEAAYAELLAQCADADLGAPVPLAILIAHIDDLPADERRRVLTKVRASRQELLRRIQDLPPHDGGAGIALQLMIAHLQADLRALAKLT